MSKANDFVSVALGEVGTVEKPVNNVKYNNNNGQPWCGYFVMWCAKQAKVSIPDCTYTPTGAAKFQGTGTWLNAAKAKPKQGDIAFFDFPGGARIDHVGIVLSDNGDGTCMTVEGNTSPEKKPKGSQANGGEVCIRTRAYAKNKKGLMVTIVGFGRPKFNS